MKTIALFLVLACTAYGQADTALHRQVYDSVNKSTAAMKTAKATARAPGVEYDSELTAWSDASGVRKITAIARDDDGDVQREFYYQDGALLFVFQAIGKSSEDRHYFRDGAMFKWLAGKEKAATKPSDPDFATVATELIGASEAFVKAVSGKAAPAKSNKDVKVQTTVGAFQGIEQGDYAHLNIKLKDGTDDSFFVLQDDGGLKAFLDTPDRFKGKQVEVRWQEREENIPEAGGVQTLKVAIGARLVK